MAPPLLLSAALLFLLSDEPFRDTIVVRELTAHVAALDSSSSPTLDPTTLRVSEPPWLAPVGLSSWSAPFGRGSSPILILVDTELTSARGIRTAAAELTNMLESLASASSVQIVDLAAPGSAFLAKATDERAGATERLVAIAAGTAGLDRLRVDREVVLQDLEEAARLAPTGGGEGRTRALLAGALHESSWLASHLNRVADLVSTRPTARPGAMVWIVDGLDLDLRSFYLPLAGRGPQVAGLSSRLDGGEILDALARLDEAFAASGWFPILVALRGAGGASAVDASRSGAGRLGTFGRSDRMEIAEAFEMGFAGDLLPGLTSSLTTVAERLEGVVVRDVSSLRAVLSRFRLGELTLSSSHITQSGTTDPPGELVVRASDQSVEVLGARIIRPIAGEDQSRARARQALLGDVGQAELDLDCSIRVQAGDQAGTITLWIEGRLDVKPLAGIQPMLQSTSIEAAVAVSASGSPPTVASQVLEDQRLTGVHTWIYRVPVVVAEGTSGIALTLRERSTGAWGICVGDRSALTSVPAVATTDPAPTLQSAAEPRPATIRVASSIRIVAPHDPAIRGRVQLSAEWFGEAPPTRVAYWLDGTPVAESDEPPFQVHLDLGRLPQLRRVVAVAFGPSGEEIARDAAVLNDLSRSPRVTITSPRGSGVTGDVDVEAVVSVPPDDPLLRLMFRWNGEPVATLTAPPWRTRLLIDPTRPQGALTAVLETVSGQLAEDVIWLNPHTTSETVDVLVGEFAVSVRGSDGRVVDDLHAADFDVRVDGRHLKIAGIDPPGSSPLHVAVVVDTSSSMAAELPSAVRALASVLLQRADRRDRVVLVGTSSSPTLLANDLAGSSALAQALGGLRVGGRSLLFDGIAFAATALADVPGRRAIVLVSDGRAQDDGRFGLAATRDLLEQLGLPLFLLALDIEQGGASARIAGKGDEGARRLLSLVGQSGGDRFSAASDEGATAALDRLFGQLDAQYRLAVYLPSEGAPLRNLKVDVARPGVRVSSPRRLAVHSP